MVSQEKTLILTLFQFKHIIAEFEMIEFELYTQEFWPMSLNIMERLLLQTVEGTTSNSTL